MDVNGSRVKFDYHGLSGTLMVTCEGSIVFKKFLWLPYKRYSVTIAKQTYQIKALLFPFNNIGLYQGKQVICKSLFPRLKYTGIVTFSLSCIKRLGLFLALMMG
ncbi:conserved hypothetical protein [Shewanella halifaxensis HAW-EB4]|uniref:Uncharacterized protein n=2 Tax=Shewanella halifaxensis TaxID=271098 RepID=B0TS91_SHEHH|nr:conserved hypothetical protein [Shewanella halifaxensis HAW-EB4]